MRFNATAIPGVLLIEAEEVHDERGLFARVYDADRFADEDLPLPIGTTYVSHNRSAGTVRGLHYQIEPATETKLIRCIAGTVYAVAVDMREGSVTRWKHIAVELSASGRDALYVPAMCAAGYQALEDGAEIENSVTGRYSPELERGVRYDDPSVGIRWPRPVTVTSAKDRGWPDIGATDDHR